MSNFENKFKSILKKYGIKNIRDDISCISNSENIPKITSLYNSFDLIKHLKNISIDEYQELILNILLNIRILNRNITKDDQLFLEKFIQKEIQHHDNFFALKLDIIARYKFTSFGPILMDLLKKRGASLEVYELDTLIYALGMIDYKESREEIEKYTESEHETVRNCAIQAINFFDK